MTVSHTTRYVAFEGSRRIAAGDLPEVAAKAKKAVDRGDHAPVQIFDGATSAPVDLDFRGSVKEFLRRLADTAGAPAPAPESEAARGPGRPRLGVVAREVTLLPRHWDWLSRQPGGASVALRKLIDEARRVNEGKDRVRQAQEAAYRFMSAMAGNEHGFEDAARALFAGDVERFHTDIASWPKDVREHVARLAEDAFGATDA